MLFPVEVEGKLRPFVTLIPMRTMMSVSLMLLISREAFESSVPRAVVIVAHIQSKSLSRLAWLSYLLNPCGLEVRYVAIPVRLLGFALIDLLLARRLLPFTVLNARSVFVVEFGTARLA